MRSLRALMRSPKRGSGPTCWPGQGRQGSGYLSSRTTTLSSAASATELSTFTTCSSRPGQFEPSGSVRLVHGAAVSRIDARKGSLVSHRSRQLRPDLVVIEDPVAKAQVVGRIPGYVTKGRQCRCWAGPVQPPAY